MDIAQYNLTEVADKGVEVTLRSPIDGKPTDIKLILAGSDSRRYRKAQLMAYRNEAKQPGEKGVYERMEELNVDVYSQCILGWSGIQENGEDIAFTTEAAQDLLSRYLWITDQIVEFVENRANFMKPVEKS